MQESDGNDTREILSYSQLQAFKNCRMLEHLRYDEEIVPAFEDPVLFRGALTHRGLSTYRETGDRSEAIIRITKPEPGDPTFQNQDEKWERDHESRLRARAILEGYMEFNPWGGDGDQYEPLVDADGKKAIEYQFCVDIINPETDAKSRSFVLGGKCDSIERKKSDGTIWIREYKTTSSINVGYLERLWTDFQIKIYKRAVETILGVPVAGILYDIMEKTGIEKKVRETDEEFKIRYDALCAKNKSGTSTAQQGQGETWDEFLSRLREKQIVRERYQMEPIILDDAGMDKLQSELWELTQQFLDARRRHAAGKGDPYYQNGGFCYHWNKPCPYFKLCRSNFSPLIRENFYVKKEAHPPLDIVATE